MINELSLGLIFIFTAVLAFTGFFAALRSAESMRDVHNEQQPQVIWATFLIFSAIMGLTVKVMSTVVYAIILLLIAGLQLINREGEQRRQSWNLLSAGFAFILIISVVSHRKDNVFHPLMLLWLIPAALPFIAGAVQAARLNRDSRAKTVELSNRITTWAVIAVLILALIAVAIFTFT